MEYNSFYGGRQGTPFIIAKSYESKQLMEADFNTGLSCDVVYNEYVIINTPNKNDAENGTIYRRIETNPGYEKIGQIVGPSGPAPTAEFESYSTGTHISEETPQHIGIPSDLVPGKDGNNFNDTIDYKYVVIRDNNNTEATVYMGFKIPYSVIDFSVNPTLVEYPTTEALQPTRIDDGKHPFYEHWELKIPKGVKGDSLTNLKIMVYDENTHKWIEPTGVLDTRPQWLVYVETNYDESAAGSSTFIPLGTYNMIKYVDLDEYGTITVNYTHNTPSEFTNALTWITSVTLDQYGKFTVTYNNNEIEQEGYYTCNLRWAKNIAIDEYGVVTITYTNGDSQYPDTDKEVLNNKIKYIDRISLNENRNGKLKVYYNTLDANQNQEFEQFDLKWINNVTLTDAGVLTFKDSTNTTVLTKTLKWITEVKILTPQDIATGLYSGFNAGDFLIKFNTDDNYIKLGEAKWIKDIQGANGYLKINYNTGSEDFIYQGMENSTGAIIAEEHENPIQDPEPSFAEGSPWFIVEEYAPFSRELSYLESTGTQYINLNVPCQTGLKAKIKFSFTDHMDQGQSIFGLRNDEISSVISYSTTYGWTACLGSPGVAIGLRYSISKSNLWSRNLCWFF